MEETIIDGLRGAAREYKDDYHESVNKARTIQNRIDSLQEELQTIQRSQEAFKRGYENIRNVIKQEERTDIGPI